VLIAIAVIVVGVGVGALFTGRIDLDLAGIIRLRFSRDENPARTWFAMATYLAVTVVILLTIANRILLSR
jgi:hypothetical protein